MPATAVLRRTAGNTSNTLRNEGPNLLSYNQATIEIDASGFAGVTNASESRVTSERLRGAASLALTCSGGGLAYAQTTNVPVTAGATYTVAAYFKAATTPRNVFVGFGWIDSGGGYLSGAFGSGIADSADGWTLAVKTAVAPVGAAAANMAPFVDGAAAGEIHYVDCIGLWAGSSTTWIPPHAPATCWGDSLTAGAGGGGATYPGLMASAHSGFIVTNCGVGGETSTAIAARQNGVPTLLTVADDSIPASGAVAVTANSAGIPTGQGPQSILGTLAGIPGTLTSTTFTRTSSGSVTACPAGTPFITSQGVQSAADVALIWAGRNNAYQLATVVSDIADMVTYLAGNKQYLVLSVLNGDGEGIGTGAYNAIVALNAALAAAHGNCYLDVREYLIQSGLVDAGVTPTSQDDIDVGNDVVPSSLRFDGVHLNADGYGVVARSVYAQMLAHSWV